MILNSTLFLLQFLTLPLAYADLVEETEFSDEQAENEEEQPQNDENVNDNEVDVQNELVEDENANEHSDSIGAQHELNQDYGTDEHLKLFVIEQAKQADETEHQEQLLAVQPEAKRDTQYEEKNIVEYKLPEPKDVNDKNITIDVKQQLADGKYVENAVELQNVVIQVLDKKSTHCELKKIELDKPVVIGKFGDLSVVLKKAFMTPENVIPFSIIGYIEIHDPKDKDNKTIFKNWMCSEFSSGITFDHPLYDIKLTNEKDI